jgi:hypothetical protein
VTEAGLARIREVWKIRVWSIALIILCGAVVPIGLWIALRIASIFTPIASNTTHSDTVTVVLAGLTISIAVLAVTVAGLAIWGYHAIKQEAGKTAAKSARQAAIKSVRNPAFRNN